MYLHLENMANNISSQNYSYYVNLPILIIQPYKSIVIMSWSDLVCKVGYEESA